MWEDNLDSNGVVIHCYHPYCYGLGHRYRVGGVLVICSSGAGRV